jgi:hypothetical protein
MVQFFSSAFAESLRCLHSAARGIAELGQTGSDPRHAAAFLQHCLANLRASLGSLGLSPALEATFQRLEDRVQQNGLDDKANRDVLLTLLEEFETSILIELRSYTYLAIPSGDRQAFDEPERWFGERVATTFPDATGDMRDCGRCLALGMWTASVFHAMRVVQRGLHRLADRLQVTFAKDIELLNWGEIIKNIDKRLKEIEQQPKTALRDAELQFGAAASSHFFAIKEAWRNYVMHGRSTYGEVEAKQIAEAVRAIMAALA